MLTSNILRYGRSEPLPDRIPLRAGPLSLYFEEGDLRTIKYGDTEVLRRIYVAVRDQNWVTVPARLSDVVMDIGGDAFCITYTAHALRPSDGIDFTWRAEISGDAAGALTFRMDGIANTTFFKNRIGFCVLHPASAAGARCVVTHVDGNLEDGVLPGYIVAAQPVLPFAEMQALRHEIAPGVWAETQFSGDIFEMEDQRNWTDASYKTFCTPLRLPFPMEVAAGTAISQSVRLALTGDRGVASLPDAAPSPVTITLHPETATNLPHLGLGVASHGQPLTSREAARLKALHLQHLRVDLRLSDPDYELRLRNAVKDATSLNIPLEIAVLAPPDGAAALQRLAALVDDIQPDIIRWLVYPDTERSTLTSNTEPAMRLAFQHLASLNPDAEFTSGTNTDFIFMQNNPPPYALLDMACLAVNPQSHAFDNASVMETLQTQTTVVSTARHVAGGKPIVVSPVTLKPRFNPYATGAALVTPVGQLPPQVDPRQMSLFGAAWTAISIKYLAQGGAFSVTYYETSGWRGVMECESGSPEPELFQSFPGAVFPLYHVLADVGEFSRGDVIGVLSSDPLRVDGLALSKDDRLRLIVANLTLSLQDVTIECPNGVVDVTVLDETNAEEAMQTPRAFRQKAGQRITVMDNLLRLPLMPYAVARIDRIS